MRTSKVIVNLEFLAEDFHVVVAKYHRMVEAFLLNRVTDSFYDTNRIRRGR
jgi:hypothetical protein